MSTEERVVIGQVTVQTNVGGKWVTSKASKSSKLVEVNGVSPLIEHGLLAVGETLVLRRRGGLRVEAKVDATGAIRLGNSLYSTPSGAARSVVGRPINGWDAWRTTSGLTLSHLRASLSG